MTADNVIDLKREELVERNSKTFLKLEPGICDIVKMKELVLLALDELDMDVEIGSVPNLVDFAVRRLGEMIDALHAKYYEREKGGAA